VVPALVLRRLKMLAAVEVNTCVTLYVEGREERLGGREEGVGITRCSVLVAAYLGLNVIK